MSTMLQIRDLLNPVTPEPSDASSDEACMQMSPGRIAAGSVSVRHPVRPREWSSNPGKQRGPVNFMPFEEGLSPAVVQQIVQFQVRPFGQIRQSCEHIPYNSSKKDFFGKTGRESIDVLKYEFRRQDGENPGDFTVMWDYDVGLVRITPFFKCLGYAKTKPSQMLDKNPGLRDITPSITGGAVSAQGYWMPFKCARAVCATFCFPIAAALIPLFGPTFPSECRVPGSAGYRDMTIDPRIIEEAKRDAQASRSMRMEPSSSFASRPAAAPKHRHVLEPRPDQRSYERRPPGLECERLMQPSPQRTPSSWKAVNAAASPITPPRSANSQRPLISGNMDRFRSHQFVEDGRNGLVLAAAGDDSPERRHAHQREFHGRDCPNTPVRPHLHAVADAYGLKRRYVSPVIVDFSGHTGDRDVRPVSRGETSPRKRTQRDGSRRIEDYHAASALVGLQGDSHVRSRG